jgi:dimethylamine monooxygenase subunit A
LTRPANPLSECTMPFDLQQIELPFQMRPDLRRLGADAVHLHALAPASPLFHEKRQVSLAAQAVHVVPGFDAGPAIAAIWQQARRDGIAVPTTPPQPMELVLQQDLAVLDLASASVPWMCICVPSGWAPEEKIGLGLAAIHAPVADSAALNPRWNPLARLLTAGGSWERHVWTISPSSRFDQHPGRHAPAPWPSAGDPEDFARRCWLRSERQTFFPVRDGQGQAIGQAVFTITVALQPLPQAVRNAADALRLQQALASMTDAVLAYKRLTAARAPLLAWLSQRAMHGLPRRPRSV